MFTDTAFPHPCQRAAPANLAGAPRRVNFDAAGGT
jgi:hypothetical protein